MDGSHGTQGGGAAYPSVDPTSPDRTSANSYKPPSIRSGGGYRLASGLMESGEGYLEPRSSAGSYHIPPTQGHHSGVDLDQSRHSHQDSSANKSSNSERSSKNSVSLHPNGGIPWDGSKDPNLPPQVVRGDSLAFRHDYEELPIGQKHGYADVNDHQGAPPYSSSDNLTAPIYRRRVNPLYDGVTRADSKTTIKSPSGGNTRCMCAAIVILTIISVAACVLASLALAGLAYNDDPRTVYMMTTPPGPIYLQEVLDRLTDLEHNYTLMMNKVSSMEAADTSHLVTELADHTSKINNLTSSLALVQTGFTQFRTEIRGIAMNISKQAGPTGPMGPSGAGNLSQCEYKITSVGTAAGSSQFATTWIPTEPDQTSYVILGVECTSDVEFHQLKTRDLLGFEQYHCFCSGPSPPPNSRHCYMHYWRCPRIS